MTMISLRWNLVSFRPMSLALSREFCNRYICFARVESNIPIEKNEIANPFVFTQHSDIISGTLQKACPVAKASRQGIVWIPLWP